MGPGSRSPRRTPAKLPSTLCDIVPFLLPCLEPGGCLHLGPQGDPSIPGVLRHRANISSLGFAIMVKPPNPKPLSRAGKGFPAEG